MAVTNQSGSLEDRARSYIDANCAQCHRPGGPGPTFDARWDTPLTNQNIINAVVSKGSLGFDNARVVVPDDIWRSILYQRALSLNSAVKMPPLARNVIDTNSLAVVAAWINSLPGVPALPPLTITPAGGTYNGSVNISFQDPTNGVMFYYTLDGSLPTTNSLPYSGPFTLTNSATVTASAFARGFNNSVAGSGSITSCPPRSSPAQPPTPTAPSNCRCPVPPARLTFSKAAPTLTNWISLSTNVAPDDVFDLDDPDAGIYPLPLLPRDSGAVIHCAFRGDVSRFCRRPGSFSYFSAV